MDLSIIIISYNTKDLLLDCIKSVIKTTKNISYEIIVVDNGSSDGTQEIIKKKYSHKFVSGTNNTSINGEVSVPHIRDNSHGPTIKLIENQTNLGFSKANNIGIKEAKGRYILFLNSDTVVHNDTLEQMVQFMEKNKETGAATCRVELPNGKLDDASHRGFPTPWNAFCHFSGLSKFLKIKFTNGYSMTYLNLSKVHEVDACCGAFMMVRREAGNQVKWWDEDYFWYGDDLDLCYRLKEKGWKIFFVPYVSILHYKGASGGIKEISKNVTTADSATKKLAQKARFDAMRIFYKKHYRNKYPWFIKNLVIGGISLRQRLSSLVF